MANFSRQASPKGRVAKARGALLLKAQAKGASESAKARGVGPAFLKKGAGPTPAFPYEVGQGLALPRVEGRQQIMHSWLRLYF